LEPYFIVTKTDMQEYHRYYVLLTGTEQLSVTVFAATDLPRWSSLHMPVQLRLHFQMRWR